MKGEVLLIDDDAAFRFAMRKALTRLGYEVREASSGEEALSLLREGLEPAVALLDLRMGGIGGLEVLKKRPQGSTRFIVLTGHGTVRVAVEAMRLGAFSFLEKPVDGDVLEPLLRQAIRERREDPSSGGMPPLIHRSQVMVEVSEFIDRVGPTDATVSILGETGTGKEVVAQHLHCASERASGPFVAMNAACVPKALFESELFGHRKGAFTGATSDHQGLFQQAHRGTLFIDELGELPIDSQAKLLRVLETSEVRPVGAQSTVKVDVRIVVATNRNLWEEVKAGRFREDLYFRLQVFPLFIPPLRDRPEDIIPLAEHLLERVGASVMSLSEPAQAALRGHEWPGNVRELLNVLRRVSLFATGDEIDGPLVRRMIAASVFGQAPAAEPPPHPDDTPELSLAEMERRHIEAVLKRVGGNITKAAQVLGIDRRTLQRKLRSLNLPESG